MGGAWFERHQYLPAMRDISDALQLGLSDEEIASLENLLDDTWHESEPWLSVSNHGPLDVCVEMAGDEIPGVAVRLSGSASEIDGLADLIITRHWPRHSWPNHLR